jgi:hypothetical protein
MRYATRGAALCVFAVSALTACGHDDDGGGVVGGGSGAQADATAACQALARTTSIPADKSTAARGAVNFRISAAGMLALSANRGDSHSYGNLNQVGETLTSDIANSNTSVSRLRTDVAAGLTACAHDKLPTRK